MSVSLISSLNSHVRILSKLEKQILIPYQISKYPIKELLSFYQKQLIPKIIARQKRSDVLSDIFLWYLPNMMGLVYRIDSCVKQQNEQILANVIDCNEQFQLAQQSTVLNVLRIPEKYICCDLIELLTFCIGTNEKSGNKIESCSLTRFINLFNKILEIERNSEVSLPIQQFERKTCSLLFSNIDSPNSKIAVKYAWRFQFIAKLKLRVKKADKRIIERKMRIYQLIEGEKKYISGLVDYIEYIKTPICSLNILTDLQTKKLFSTIQSILAFHRLFQQELSKRFANYEKYTTFGDLIKRNIPFFKIYTDYIEYADEAQTLLLNLEETNEDVQKICNKFMLEKQKKASDELKQPTFRIARYGMILSQIIKNTNQSHPDYPLLKIALKDVSTNLSKINQTVDTIARRTRLYQLEQQFGTEERPILKKSREFIEQFHLHLISDDKMESVIMFVFSDLVILIDSNRRVLKWIDIDEKFYVRREEDNKTYRNIIKIHYDGFMMFSAGKEDRHYSKAEQLQKLLKGICKSHNDMQKMVYVHVIGTQQKNTSNFNKYTQYIAQIQHQGLRKFSRLRFSLMKSFVQKIQEFYNNELGISLDQSLKDSWLYNYSSKTIEDRKRAIEQILQKMLNHPLVRSNPAFILNQLGIQPNFLKTANSLKMKRNASCEDTLQSVTSKQSEKQLRQAETILCATQIKQGRDSYHDVDFLGKKVNEGIKVEIQVYTMVGQEPIKMKISELYTVQDVCYEVSNVLDLKTNRDFRLFHEVGKKELRVLDHDHKIMKIFTFSHQKHTNSLFNLFGVVKNFISPQEKPKLIFKKYYFLPTQIEQAECKKDTTRLRLLVYQIFNQIKQMKYHLSFEEYLLFLAILIYIEYDGEIPQETQASYVSKIVPQKIFKIKNESQEYWLNQCRPHMNFLKQQINQIIEHNKQKAKNKRIQHDSPIHFGHRHICSLLAIRKITVNPIYGSNLFYVQLAKNTYEKLIKNGKNVSYNMWLVIKVQCFLLMTPSKEIVLEVQLNDIERIVVETEGIIFKIESMASCEYCLHTYQPFQISELVKYYKCLKQTIQELDKNQLLINKTKIYKKELSNYRSSYEKAERESLVYRQERYSSS